MKVTRVIKGAVKPFVDIPTWIGYRQIADTTKSIGRMFKTLFIVPTASASEETFEAAMLRMNLTEADIARRKKEFSRLCALYVFIACSVFSYTAYLAWNRSIIGSIAGLSITLVALCMAFRYHFWLFQLKQRRLGCTFRDWWNSGLIL